MIRIKKSEISRKGLHLFSSIIPMSYFFIFRDRQLMFIILFSLSIIALTIEYFRNIKKGIFNKIFIDFLSPVLRQAELNGNFTGATWMMLSFALTVLLFDLQIAVSALLFLSIGDAVAALVGKQYPIGKIWNKSVFASFISVITCIFVVSSIHLQLQPIIIIVGAISAMIIELVPLKINDNFSIPLFSGFTMQLCVEIL